MNRFNLILIAFGLYSFSTFSQLSDKSKLKLDEIMKGNEFIGHQPENFQWNLNSDQIYFDWNKENNPFPSTYVFSFKDYNQIITKTKYHKIDTKERAKQVIQQAKYPSIYYVYQGGLWKFTKKLRKISLYLNLLKQFPTFNVLQKKRCFSNLGILFFLTLNLRAKYDNLQILKKN